MADDAPSIQKVMESPLVQQKDVFEMMLNSENPVESIRNFQRKRGLSLPSLEPGLQFLDLMNVKRGDVYRTILNKLVSDLGDRIPHLPPETLTILAKKCLPFLAVPELEHIAIKILSVHPSPPSKLLRTISTLGPEVSARLPDRIKLRMWECNLGSFLDAVTPLLNEYLEETSTGKHFNAMYPASNSRLKDLRKRNTLLQKIVKMIGNSSILYRHVMLMVRERFHNTGDERLCSFRNEILMALHGASAEGIWKKEPCHHFAWYMDAFVNYINNVIWEGDERAARLAKAAKSNPSKAANSFSPTHILPEVSRKITGVVTEYHKVLHGRVIAKPAQGGSQLSAAETLKKEVAQIIERVKKADEMNLFHLPVLQSHPNLVNLEGLRYDKVVARPMDTSTIISKAQNSQYTSVDELRQDLSQIFLNSNQFWGPKHNITKAARKIFTSRVVTNMLESASQAVREAKRAEDAKRASEAKKAERRKGMNGMELSDRALELMALSDSRMILASSLARTALAHGLWVALRAEVIEKEILPRDSQISCRFAFLLEQSLEAHASVARSRGGERTPPSVLSTVTEREVLPVLALFAYHGGVLEERELKHVSECCRNSDVGKWALMVKFVRLVHQREGKPMVQALLDVFQDIRLPTDFQHVGFYLSVANGLESKRYQEACKAKDGSWNQLALRSLDELLLRAIEEESALESPTEGPLSRSAIELHAVFAQAVSAQLQLGLLPGGRLFAMISRALAQLVSHTGYVAGTEEYTKTMQERYLGAKFCRARARYEKVFENDFSWRPRCHVPSKDQVQRLQVTPNAADVVDAFATKQPASFTQASMLSGSPALSPSGSEDSDLEVEGSPKDSVSGDAGIGNTNEAQDDSAASESENDSDDDDLEGLFRPSPKRVRED